ncbi:MAG: hypothetical protein KA354_19590 [Phycisphaerae bacterium]|nr:hypothetical protein [Phycisphaerae bacterium]
MRGDGTHDPNQATRRQFLAAAGAAAVTLAHTSPSLAAETATHRMTEGATPSPGRSNGPVPAGGELKIAFFQADVTPPLGSPLCRALVRPARKIIDPLSARGLVLLTDQRPIVLCALDWTSVQNGGYRVWREALAKAAGTTPERVAVHAVHQHDAPSVDFDIDELLIPRGLGGSVCDGPSARAALERAGRALSQSLEQPRRVTHLGLGQAEVDRVASNRRIIGPDGKILHGRMSSCKDPEVAAHPEGTIDPYVKLVSFWDGDTPLAAVTYYATHPQSFYGRGAVSADFVGLARSLREATEPEVFHVHFNGAGGNVAAGKYNDGSPGRRFELAGRLADGMARAWEGVKKEPLRAADLGWRVLPVKLPVRKELTEEACLKVLDDPNQTLRERANAAGGLIWLRRCARGESIDLTCLRMGNAYVLHMPGELFVEYQLAAAAMRPDAFLCMAAYGDCGPQYIGTKIGYAQGGYETGPASCVAPETEQVLESAIRALLA